MQPKIGKLWLQTHITVSFRYTILCVLTCITSKYRSFTVFVHIKWLLIYQFIFWVRVACKIWLVSYSSKHALQSLFNMPFVHTGITWNVWVVYRHSTYMYWTTGVLPETFLAWFRVAWEIRLTTDCSRHTSQSFFDTTLCMYSIQYILQCCTYMKFLMVIYALHQNSHVACYYTTHQTMALLPTMHHFIRTKSYVMMYKLLQSIASTSTLWCLSNYSGPYECNEHVCKY